MTNETVDCITKEHLTLFGAIVHWFARYEALIGQITAAISGADPTATKFLTGKLSLAEKRDALFDLLRHRAVPLDDIEQLRASLVVLETFAPLRHDIAHSEWVKGSPRNSIAPLWLTAGPLTAIKPKHNIGESTEDFIEAEEDSVTYTLADLEEVVRSLERNYVGLRACTAKMTATVRQLEQPGKG